jgi:SAM-dependent methyltransferase
MGLARGAIALLLDDATGREVAAQFRKFDVAPRATIDPKAPELDDTLIFRALGFEELHSLDYSDFEGATHVVDLNQLGLPDQLIGYFDVVLDSGTLEHVFHVPNALANVVSMVKVGGRVIFLAPSSNHLDHGFYMFSPTFFSDYFAANGFRIEKLYVVRYSGDMDAMWEAYEYEPGRWRDLHIGGLDDAPYAIFVVATKTPQATSGVVPQQGYYADSSAAYQGSHLAKPRVPSAPQASRAGNSGKIDPAGSSRRAQVKAVLCRVPGGLRAARTLFRIYSRISTRGPAAGGIRSKKLVGRY